ncbi:hypothetical protein IW262DRAFT_1295681 [Armillaria fumosa]|nr:hypothetical protein IW262DRAFT_1295681 [Armillaria fumosa]
MAHLEVKYANSVKLIGGPVDLLLASLFPLGSLPSNPFPTTAHLSSSPKTAEEIHWQLLALAESRAKDYTQHKLLGELSTVHCLWKNTVALGVDDDGLWEVLHAAWGVYLTAEGWTDGRLHLRKGELIPDHSLLNLVLAFPGATYIPILVPWSGLEKVCPRRKRDGTSSFNSSTYLLLPWDQSSSDQVPPKNEIAYTEVPDSTLL